MRSLSASLDSQQSPFTRRVVLTALCDRAVLAIEGGAPGDLEFRFRINRELRRSSSKESSNYLSLRRPQKAQLAFDNTVIVTVDEVNKAEDILIQMKSSLEEERDSLRAANVAGAAGGSDGSLPVNLPLGWKMTKKGKIIQSLDEIQQEELVKKKVEELNGKIAAADKDLILIGRMRQAAEATVAERLEKAWKEYKLANANCTRTEFGQSDLFRTASQAIALPRLTTPVTGVVVETYLHSFPPEDLKGRFLEFLDRHPSDPFWYAPQQAVQDGAVQPLDQTTSSWLLKNQSNKKLKISALDKGAKERMAWRWLIISHNQVNPTNRVKLLPQLSVRYERKGALTLVAKKPAAPTAMDITKAVLEEFRKVVSQPSASTEGPTGKPEEQAKAASVVGDPTVLKENVDLFLEQTFGLLVSMTHGRVDYDKDSLSFKSKPGVPKSLEKSLNSWCESADALLKNKCPPSITLPEAGALQIHLTSVTCVNCGRDVQLDELFESPEERHEWLLQHDAAGVPYSCGCVGTETPSSPADTPEEPVETFQDSDGRTWVREDIDFFPDQEGLVLLTMVKGGVNYLARQDGTPLDTKGKKKMAPPPEKKAGSPPRASSSAVQTAEVPKVEKKGGQPDKSTSPLSQENPLRVKGEPASRALSDDQRKALRQFFKLKEGLIPPVEWSTMNPKQRAQALKERSIPRWATAAVLRRPENLEQIVKGSLTKDNIGDALAVTPTGKQTQAHGQAIEAWTALKQDFRGVTLYREPVTSKERAFKKRFDQLIADYGEQKAFPRPKERPDKQGRDSSRVRGNPVAGFEGFLQMAKAFGEVAKAFK
jgi:hypothetical protein